MLADYHAWLKIADAALPRNFLGYLIQLCLRPLRTDPFATAPYSFPSEIAKCGHSPPFLSNTLPEREGPRPQMVKWMAPHRQISQLTGEEMHTLLEDSINSLATQYSSHTLTKTSVLEKEGPALFSIATPHAIAAATKREIVHVHRGGDFSLHLCLSPADCKEVIVKKWGERLTLAGTLMPHEYLLVYTPRTREEVAVVKGIVEAAILFMTGGAKANAI
ncbi:hypothetical protein LSUE1_G005607 [Lachnellula suecica]|uniref:Luciferase domain-containing protein n=1 Tax=Lachnellula suecica TaxID=602035 RepID=A0A8T9C4G9_9HELO|nr:hypothetical protein LSUE1_G005607 [Lachnellula suecica]